MFDFRDSAPVRLLGGLGDDSLPAGKLVRRDGIGVADKASLRDDGHKPRHPNLGAFLQDKLEFVAGKETLIQSEPNLRLAGGGSFLLDPAEDSVLLDFGEDYLVFVTRVVQDDDAVAFAHPQDGSNLVRLAATKYYLLIVEIRRRDKESVHRVWNSKREAHCVQGQILHFASLRSE
jgi:hypothetical protein